MFNQEVAFRSQITTMEDCKQKGSCNYNLHQGGINPIPINLNYQSKGSKKPIDLQLSADEFISQCADDFSAKQSIFSKNFSLDKFATGVDYPTLSLSIGRDASKVGEENRLWKGKKSCTSSYDIIDLEDESFNIPKYDRYFGHASNSFSGQNQKLDSFLDRGKQKLESSSRIGNGSFNANTLTRSTVDASLSCQTHSLFNSEIYGHQGSFLPANCLTQNQGSLNCKVNNLDLNKVQLEDPSYFSNDHSMVVNSSITSSSPVFGKLCPKSNVKGIYDTQLNGVNIQDVGEKISKDSNFGEGSGPQISYIDLDSDSSEELCSSKSDPKNSSVGSSSKTSNALIFGIDLNCSVGAEANVEKDAEHSSESECLTDNHSNSVKTMQSGVGNDDVIFSTSDERKKNKTCDPVAQSGEQDLRSSDSTESITKCIIRENVEDYGIVQKAAEQLVQMSFEPQACCQGEMSKMPFQNKDGERPQWSLDSYEEMVLKAEEMSPDDYCVSSNAFVVSETEKKEVTYKLKRGTRMRNFQKDILPNLSTLARHEIQEDVNILQGVMRSHEYKRIRRDMADGKGDLCRSAKSKRSRVSRR